MKNSNEILNSMMNQTPEYSEKAFKSVIPDFSFSVSGMQITMRVKTIIGADTYEVYQSKKAQGAYVLLISSPSPIDYTGWRHKAGQVAHAAPE